MMSRRVAKKAGLTVALAAVTLMLPEKRASALITPPDYCSVNLIDCRGLLCYGGCGGIDCRKRA